MEQNMNNVNIQISVNDKELAELIKGNLKSLPDEKIQEIFSTALTEILKSDVGMKLFIDKGSYYDSKPTATLLLQNIINRAISEDLLKPMVDDMIKFLSENYETVIRQCIVDTFSNLFMTEMKDITIKANINNLYGRINDIDNKGTNYI